MPKVEHIFLKAWEIQLSADGNTDSSITLILSLILKKCSSYDLSPKFVHAKIIT